MKEQGHGPPSLSFSPSVAPSKADKVDTATQPAIVLLTHSLPRSNSLARSIRGRTDGLTRNKKERYFVAAASLRPTPLLLISLSTLSSPAACPFVRQSDSPSVLRGLLPLPPTKWWSERTSADGSISAVYDLAPADNNILS